MRTTAAAVLAILALMAAPVAADVPEDYEPEFVRQDAWFHANSGPVGNLDASEGRFVRWDDEEPTGTIPAVYHGNNLAVFTEGDHGPQNFFTAQGTFTGDLDTIAFDLYLHGWAQSTIGCAMSLSFDFRIDGEWVLYQDYLGSHGVHYEAVSPYVVKAKVALTNIWEASKVYGVEYGPDVAHDVYVNIQNFYICNEFTWLYDAADYPSGLIANLESPAASGYFEIDVLDPPPPLE